MPAYLSTFIISHPINKVNNIFTIFIIVTFIVIIVSENLNVFFTQLFIDKVSNLKSLS